MTFLAGFFVGVGVAVLALAAGLLYVFREGVYKR